MTHEPVLSVLAVGQAGKKARFAQSVACRSEFTRLGKTGLMRRMSSGAMGDPPYANVSRLVRS